MAEELGSSPGKSPQSSQREKTNLDQFVKNDNIESLESLKVRSSEERKGFNNRLAGNLAVGIVSGFGVVILWHIIIISLIILGFNHNAQQVENIMNESVSVVNDVATSLYKVIVPIASTVIGFYFAATSRDDSSS